MGVVCVVWHMCGVVCLYIPKEAKESIDSPKAGVVDNCLLVLVVEH